MSNFGELVLVLGDLHIPYRASKIPAPFKRMLVPNRMQHVICTGNVSLEQYETELRPLAPNIHMVAGDYDDTGDDDYVRAGGSGAPMMFPETRVVQVGAFRIGVIHGHQLVPWKSMEALGRMRRKLNVDILIAGHTHQNEIIVQDDGYCFINPGSITGAPSPLRNNVTPSFVLLAIQDTKVVCYVYELINGEVEVSKTEFSKKDKTSSAESTLLQSLLK